MANSIIYNLIFRKDENSGNFVYEDFIRPTDRNIYEEKQEIKTNIALYGMDKQIEYLLVDCLCSENYQQLLEGYTRPYIAVKVSWDNKEKQANIIDIGFYN